MSAHVSFLAELERRDVYKVGAMYAVDGWLLVQVIRPMLQIFQIPESTQRGLALVIIVGFPIALVLAWLFDLTPIVSGQAKLSSADRGPQSMARQENMRVIRWVGLAAMLNGCR